MKIIEKYMKNKSIRYKLIINASGLLLSAVVILNILATQIFTWSMKDEFNRNTLQLINQVEDSVEFYVRDMENIIYYLTQDSEVVNFFSNGNEKNVNVNKIKKLLSVYKSSHPDIAGILLVDGNGNHLSNSLNKLSRDSLIEEQWYKQALGREGELTLLSRPIGRNIVSENDYSGDNITAIVKAIYKDNRFQGVILIDLNLEFMKNIIKDVGIGNKGFVCIMDDNGDIVYAPNNDIVYRINPSWFKDNEVKNIIKTIKAEKYQIQYTYSDYTKWKTLGILSLNETLKPVYNIHKFTFIFALIILFLGISISIVITNSITKPIEKLRFLMKRAEEGELDVSFNSKYDDEIGQLGKSFNKMINSTKNLINLVYVEQQKKREAELKILQSQIKPHFLYNTLDTIQWIAIEHGSDEIVSIVRSLTNLFRIGLSKGKEQITVAEEIRHVDSYLRIQLSRYEDKFIYEFNIDDDLKDLKVTKIILQPIVENAIYHGIKTKRGKGRISIDIYREDDDLIFKVIDDGIGIPEQTLKYLSNTLENIENRQEIGYGLFNVHERIKLTFGKKYGVSIFSDEGKGTEVIIRHPIIK